MTPPLPDPLARLRDEARAFEALRGAMAQTVAGWEAQAERIGRLLGPAPFADEGATVHLGALSPGCEACQAGAWDCVFGTMACNLSCRFCISPGAGRRRGPPSALGGDLATLCQVYARSGVRGVGFTGGEPLLEPELLLHRASVLRRELPHLYLWAYTNGLLLTARRLDELASAGLDELRFNLAATAYSHPGVLRLLGEAVARLPSVAVEVPAIPDDREALLSALPGWVQAGVKYLNLHELIFEPGSRSGSMPGVRADCTMPDGHVSAFDPRSEDLVAEVIARVADAGWPLAVHFCSMRDKARQIAGRRRLMAAHRLRPTERLRQDGLAESLCRVADGRLEFAHPSLLAELPPGWAGGRVAIVRRLIPLHPDAADQWVHFELVP